MNSIAEFYSQNKPVGMTTTEGLFLALKDNPALVKPRRHTKSVFVGMRRCALADEMTPYYAYSVGQAVNSYATKLGLSEQELFWLVVCEDNSSGVKLSLKSAQEAQEAKDSRILGFICERKSDIRKEFGVNRVTSRYKKIVTDRLKAEVETLEAWVNNVVFKDKVVVNGIVTTKEEAALAEQKNPKLQTFKVTISERSFAYFTVEAESMEDALTIADEKIGRGEFEFTHYKDFNTDVELDEAIEAS